MSPKQKVKPHFFSVIIPVYNKGPHMHRSISSLLNQTFQDFEVILVNDASTDNSLEEINKFKDERFRVFQRNEPGPGGYAARNFGIKEAKGRWIAFLDADDEWLPDHLNKMHNLSKEYPNVSLMGCGWLNKKYKEIIMPNTYYNKYKSKGNHIISCIDYLKSCVDKSSPIWTSIACVKNDLYFISDLFPENEEAKKGGDLYAWIKIICFTNIMAWSNHIGAIYHRDSINSVVKQSPSSNLLMRKDLFKKLSPKLNYQEKILLRKYFNMLLKNAWVDNKIKLNSNFFLPVKLYWKHDFLKALIYSMISLMPRFMILYALQIKKKHHSSHITDSN